MAGRRGMRVTGTVAVTTLAVVGVVSAAPVTASPSPAAKSAANQAPAVIAGISLDTATITQLESAMSKGRFSAAQLVGLYERRIGALNPKLHAVISVNPDAGRDAKASDQRRKAGHVGVLEGIPVLLKDNIGTDDLERTTAGSFALVKADPKDAFLVKRLRAAGAIVLGKANLSEWANFRSAPSSSGLSGVGGQTNSPYVLDRNPCGSSSGSAVAAAADLATVTIGTETDGSIVCPSGTNGDVGFKPTLGLISRTGVVPISAEQDTAGPITRNVTDAVIVLGALTGVDPADPATKASKGKARTSYTSALNPGALRGARIGIWDADAKQGSPATEAVLNQKIAAMKKAGATIIRLSDLPYQTDIGNNEFPALLSEFHHDINAYLASLPGEHPRTLAGLIAFDKAHADIELQYFGQEIFELAQQSTANLSDPTYREQRSTTTSLARRSIDETIRKYHLDAIAAPTNAPAELTSLTNGDTFTPPSSSSPAAAAGYPDVTVPMGLVNQLPVGLSFFAGRWSEPKVIALAYSFEQLTKARRAPHYLSSIPSPSTASSNAKLGGSSMMLRVTAHS